MNCQKCGLDFPDTEIQESHNVPCYLFKGDVRPIRKSQADKYGRKILCKKCHGIYEGCVLNWIMDSLPDNIREAMIVSAERYSKIYFPKKSEVYNDRKI